jgi:hypothetical protein
MAILFEIDHVTTYKGSTRSAIEESTQALATAAQLRNRRL